MTNFLIIYKGLVLLTNSMLIQYIKTRSDICLKTLLKVNIYKSIYNNISDWLNSMYLFPTCQWFKRKWSNKKKWKRWN